MVRTISASAQRSAGGSLTYLVIWQVFAFFLVMIVAIRPASLVIISRVALLLYALGVAPTG
jgi:hypothetical protein